MRNIIINATIFLVCLIDCIAMNNLDTANMPKSNVAQPPPDDNTNDEDHSYEHDLEFPDDCEVEV
jgi:hypothetical protein